MDIRTPGHIMRCAYVCVCVTGIGGSWIGSISLAWGRSAGGSTDGNAAAAVLSRLSFVCWDSDGGLTADNDQQYSFQISLPNDLGQPTILEDAKYIINDDYHHQNGFTQLSLT